MSGIRFATLFASCSLTALAVPAFAQGAGAQDSAAPLQASTNTVRQQVQLAPADQSAASAAEVADVIVTGSRVITNGNNSPTPITVVTTAALQASTPSNIPDALNKLPIFSGSRGQATINNASSNATGNFLNLRGVGAIRTLILFDGHRVPPTGQDGTIDTNTIPQLLLQRVDVVTGGASAVYGSDAVTGVVNFIVDKKFNGLKVQGQYGISGFGDNASYRFGIAGGTDLFGGRGHFEASYEHYNSDGITSKLARANGRLVYSEEGAGTAANPFHLVANTRNSASSFSGLILKTTPASSLAGLQFSPGGGLVPFNHGAPTGSTGIESGGDGVYALTSSLLASLRSDQAFARFDFEVSDNVNMYAQVSASRAVNGNIFGPAVMTNVVLSASNAFLSAAEKAQLAGAGATNFNFSRTFAELEPNRVAALTKNLFGTVGLNGKLFAALNFDLAYSYGETRQTVTNVNNVNTSRYFASLDAVSSNGQIVCNVAITNPGLYPGCVPLNPFRVPSEAAAAFAYFRNDTHSSLTNRMNDVAASISGAVFDTWAGPVRIALSGEYRSISLRNESDAQPTAHPSCTGLRFNCTATTQLYIGNTVADAYGSEGITEGAFEANVPLLRDSPLLGSFNLNGAVRYAHYSVSGNATTWKLGAEWRLTRDLTFRSTRSQDIRAPTLNDLFAPVNASPTGFTDIHTTTSGTVTTQSQGNPNLVPEVAQTFTVGAVYRPHWLPRFSIAVDYYDIKIKKAIASIGGNNAGTLAQCEASGGTSPLCALYIRPLPFENRTPANYPTLILTQGLNAASLTTHGVDTEINYSVPIGQGNLSFRGLASYQPSLVTVQFPGAVRIDAAGAAGQASWKLTGFLGYTDGKFSANLQERWRNAEKQSGNPTLVYSDPKIPAAAFTDLTLSYQATAEFGKAEFFLSIQNLFDKTAPVYISTAYASSPGFYYPAVNGDDIVGRYFTMGVRAKF
jgi:outer membrane receptor protein involved in Fe transport